MPRKKQQKPQRGSGSIKLRGRIYWLKYYVDGEPREESSGLADEAAARALLAQKVGEARFGDTATLAAGSRKLTMNDLFKLVVADYIKHDRDTLDQVKVRMAGHLAGIGKIVAEDLSDDDVDAYIIKRKQQGAAPATINRELSIVIRAQNLAWKRKPRLLLQPLPIVLLDENNVRRQEVTNDAYVKLLGLIKPWWRLWLIISYHSGMRLMEVLGLEWSQVDWDARLIRLDPGTTKNDEARELPFYGDLEDWLKAAYANQQGPFICHRDGRQLKKTYKAWKSACAKAGYPGLNPHDLRRAALRNMVRNGITRETAKKISGHKTMSTFDRYQYSAQADMQMVRERMAGVIPSTPVAQFMPPVAMPKPKAVNLGTVAFDKSRKSPKKWHAMMSWDNQNHSLGRYLTEAEARAALRVKYLELVAEGKRPPLPEEATA